MTNLEFKEVENQQKEIFKPNFQAYLEEIDLASGRPVNPDFQDRFPEYDSFFTNNPKRRPFQIMMVTDPRSPTTGRVQIGFFFLKLITPQDFPEEIDPIFDVSTMDIAWLKHFYIYPEHRRKGLAAELYQKIIEFANKPINKWHLAWECDKKNDPAVKFCSRIVHHIHEEHEISKQEYIRGDNERKYIFYQIKFNY